MNKVLITGSDGFIGSHLTEKLVKDGIDVKAFVMYNSFNSNGWLDRCDENIKSQFEIFSGDIRDPYTVKKAMKGCDKVLHLAALIGIPYSYISPDSYIDTNVKGTLNILEAARDNDVNSIVHTSTSEVYGTAQFTPITEKHPLIGQSPYSASKIAADQIAYSYYSSFGMPVKIARPFNTYGPRQSNRAIIPTIISQILSSSKTIKLGSLSPKREFNFIDDTISGFKKILLSKKAIGETINLGNGSDFSINELVKLIKNIMHSDKQVKTEFKRMRPKKSEVQVLKASNLKAKKILNWTPKYRGKQGLKAGLTETIDWFSDKKNIDQYKKIDYVV